MSNGDGKAIHGSSDGGVAGTHGPVAPFRLLVGPATADEFNTARLNLIPVACFRVDDIRFAFDSSFITSDPANPKNDVRAELQLLVDLRKLHPDSPLSVFGHADPIGSDEYNKQLSGRRATVVYALLISSTDPDAAVALWQKVAKTENWGDNQRRQMQVMTALPAGTPDADLFKAYMKKLTPDGLTVSKQEFLGQGADPQGKGDYQGCGEFNPALIFSTKKNNEFEAAKDKTPRDDANAANRRVIVLLFRKGSKVDPTKWPCPRATEDTSGCRKRFWSDGETRRSKRLPDKDRKFADSKDTFACRFYHRLLTNSPCESPLLTLRIRLFDRQAKPLPFAPCLVTEGGKPPKPDRASGAPPPAASSPAPSGSGADSGASGSPDDDKQGAFITIGVLSLPAKVNVKWSVPKSGDDANSPLPKPGDKFDFEMDVLVDIPDAPEEKSILVRLNNLGYLEYPVQADNIRAFQTDYKPKFGDIEIDGTLNDATKKAIKAVHDGCDVIFKSGPHQRSIPANEAP